MSLPRASRSTKSSSESWAASFQPGRFFSYLFILSMFLYDQPKGRHKWLCRRFNRFSILDTTKWHQTKTQTWPETPWVHIHICRSETECRTMIWKDSADSTNAEFSHVTRWHTSIDAWWVQRLGSTMWVKSNIKRLCEYSSKRQIAECTHLLGKDYNQSISLHDHDAECVKIEQRERVERACIWAQEEYQTIQKE